MNSLFAYIKTAFVFCISYLGYFLGEFDSMMVTLLIFMVIDYISGVINALLKKELSSNTGFKGICKKAYILLIVGCINLLGNSMGINELRYIVISFYIANEGISLIENASAIGVPIPEKIIDVLEQLKNKGSDT